MAHLSDAYMLDLLKRVQAIQVKTLNAGFSAHVDANFCADYRDPLDHYIAFDVSIFSENDLVKSFYFWPYDTQEENEAVLAQFDAFINSVK